MKRINAYSEFLTNQSQLQDWLVDIALVIGLDVASPALSVIFTVRKYWEVFI